MSSRKQASLWRVAESAIIPVVERLFAEGDVVPALQPGKEFRFGGIGVYEGAGTYEGLRTRVVLLASPDAEKADAKLFPIALAPVLRGMEEAPGGFDRGRVVQAVRSAWRAEGLDSGDFPSFYTNETYYYAICRELLARLRRAAALPVESAVVRDERGVEWVRGTKVKALEVVASHVAHGWSAEEIRRQHPGLELSAIHAVLAWYYANQSGCDALLAADLALAERLRAEQGESPLAARVRRSGRAA